MPTLLLTFCLFLAVMFLMAIGVLVTGKTLRGSCGGPSCSCAAEGKDVGSCETDGPSLPVLPSNSQF